MQTTISAPGVLTNTARYGGFWIRFVALIIDGIILSIVQFVVISPILAAVGLAAVNPEALNPEDGLAAFSAMMGAMGLIQLISLAIGFLYCTLMESGKNQGTLGKMALGLKVVDQDGQRLSFGKAALRYIGKLVSGIILFIGYLMAAFNPRKQALHDMVAGTLVVRK